MDHPDKKFLKKLLLIKIPIPYGKLLKTFLNFQWNPSIKSIDVKNNEIGSERVLNFGEGTVTQKLEN